MLALTAAVASAFLAQGLHHAAAPSSKGMPGWASMQFDPTNPEFLAFDEVFSKGGVCIQDGDMPGALGYFQQALEIDPTNEQTKKMVKKLQMLGIEPVKDESAVSQARANAVKKLLDEPQAGTWTDVPSEDA